MSASSTSKAIKYTKSILFMILAIAIGYGIGASNIIDIFIADKVSGLNLFISMLLMPLWIIGIHELGHLLTGLAQGFRFAFYIVGPLGVKRNEEGSIRVYLNKDLALYGGVAATEPAGDPEQIKRRFGNVIIAGPITSLSFAIIQLVLAYQTTSSLDFFLALSGLGHLAIFYGTTVPDKSGFFFTDRKRWQRLNSNSSEADAELAILHASYIESRDKSLANADRSQLEMILLDQDDFCQFFGHYFLWKYHNDNKQIDLGNSHLEFMHQNQQLISPSIWKMLQLPKMSD